MYECRYRDDCNELVIDVQRRRTNAAAAELRMAKEQSRRDAAKAAKAAAIKAARDKRIKDGMKADLAAVETLKAAKLEAKRREAEEDVRVSVL